MLDSLRQIEARATAPSGCQALPLAAGSGSWEFTLPGELEAGEPPEARGLERDQVRLMVSHFKDDSIRHTQFSRLEEHLSPGDLLVINTSGTLKAALNASSEADGPLELHLSTRLPADLWTVELRRVTPEGSQPFYTARAGQTLALPGGGSAALLTPYRPEQRGQDGARVRLWVAALDLPLPLLEYLDRHGFPIRYPYVRQPWPAEYYQTVYATEPGSVEMPSAGRAFTLRMITRLVARGVRFAPLVLHTGVASLEHDEPPYEEYYRVPWQTANLVNETRRAGGRVIAVGTTSVRALETLASEDGRLHPGEGWTGLVITPEHRLRLVDGMLTGLHEPRSTHLAMLEALAGRPHICRTYAAALERGYLWHEFGDLHLILP